MSSASSSGKALSTRRASQISELSDRAPYERIAYYSRMIKAESIGNRGATRFFQSRAQQWERIRVLADRALMRDGDARLALRAGDQP
jgi:hypothetical protein